MFQSGTLNVVLGDRGTGAALVAHKTPQMVAITGSVRAGMEVAKSAALDVKRVHLELGGKAPAIVFADASIDKAVEGIITGAFFNGGQDCTAATRVLVHASRHDELIAALKQRGAGELVHPYYGRKTVTLVSPARISETPDEGGMARFSLDFIEAGFPQQGDIFLQ